MPRSSDETTVAGPLSTTPITTPLAAFVFRREGEFWTLEYDGGVSRLKDALGLDTLSSTPRRVSLAALGARGAHLDAYLLDVKRTFDELVLGLASTPEQARESSGRRR